MHRHLVVLPAAKRDIEGIVDEIAAERPRAARRFAVAARSALEFLVRFPHVGSLWRARKRSQVGLRVWTMRRFRRYVIFYRVRRNALEIIRVVHGSRDLNALLDLMD